MGLLFRDKPQTYAPPLTPPAPTMLGPTPTPVSPPTAKYTREAGHDIQLSSGYRTQAEQDDIIRSGKGKMPAKQSLHSAGLAVDVNSFDGLPEPMTLDIRHAADRAGLS
ncbi:MAG: hypothetical protein ACHQPH_14725 [Reyranellales bacterium]